MSQINPLEVLAALPPEARINFEAHQQRLADYVAGMAPGKPLTNEAGVAFQMSLWNSIKIMLAKQGSEFVLHYSEMLKTIRENRRGAFSERHLFRFFEYLRISSEDRRNFERLLNLMVVTCDPGLRQLALRQVDMRSSLSGLKSEQQRQNICAYYAL